MIYYVISHNIELHQIMSYHTISYHRSSYQGESPSSSSRERDRVGERPGERERRGADMDPVLDPSHVDQWFTHEASPKQKKEFSNVYDR